MARSNQPVSPTSTVSAEAIRKAPTASGIEVPCALVASRAAPGVDQAMTTGAR